MCITQTFYQKILLLFPDVTTYVRLAPTVASASRSVVARMVVLAIRSLASVIANQAGLDRYAPIVVPLATGALIARNPVIATMAPPAITSLGSVSVNQDLLETG